MSWFLTYKKLVVDKKWQVPSYKCHKITAKTMPVYPVGYGLSETLGIEHISSGQS